VSAIGAMHMPIIVATTCVTGCTCVGIFFADGKRVLFDDSVLTLMMEVPVVQVINVVVMHDSGMFAIRAVTVVVVRVNVFAHTCLLERFNCVDAKEQWLEGPSEA